jgi:hypothetical protein
MSALEDAMAVGETYTMEDLASRVERSTAELLSDLALLEISGRVRRVAGGGFVRLD